MVNGFSKSGLKLGVKWKSSTFEANFFALF